MLAPTLRVLSRADGRDTRGRRLSLSTYVTRQAGQRQAA